MERQIIRHTIQPVFDTLSRVLVLGTMPSPKSREAGFFYGHPQNRFWCILAELFDEPLACTNERRVDQLLRHHIALWDVLASCSIEGASDSSIADAVPNDLSHILDVADIQAVFCTGAKAAQLYRKLCEPVTGLPCVQLPSPSAANAAMRLPDLVKAYGAALSPYCAEAARPVLPVCEVVALEQAIAASGTSLAELMDRAGGAVAHRVSARMASGRVVVLCGSGNNGGDGWVAARILAAQGANVTLVTAKAPEELKAQPARDAAHVASDAFAVPSASAASGPASAQVLVRPTDKEVRACLMDADVIVDAILGTGFAGDTVKEPYATWIRLANEAREQGVYVVAADTPSGLHVDDGTVAATCIQADETVTMIVGKPGLFLGEGKRVCGDVHIAPLAYIEPLL